MNFIELLGMVMLVVMLFAIFVGIPISFTLLFLALIFGFVGLGATVFDLAYLQTIGLMKQDEFVAVPMFILMGYICDQAGLMERLFKAFRDLFAPVRGALYLVVLLTATLFGIAAGTVGILIPPSVMLVVMGPVLGVSVLQLYAAAFGPGFLLAGMYIVYTMGRSFMNPKLGPPVAKEERVHSLATILWECVVGLVPVTVLPVSTLGAILAGLTTSTEAAALGALGAILLVIGYGRFRWKGLFAACQGTLATTSMVLFLAVAANIFGAVFARFGTATWITNSLIAVPLPAWGTMSLLLTLIFLLGWPFEWPAIVLIFLPMIAPVATGLVSAMIGFGTIVAVVLQTAFLSPPVAMSAYYLKQAVKEWSLSTIYRGMYEFMVIQCLCVALVLIFPQIAMWFPQWLQEGDRMAVPALPGDES